MTEREFGLQPAGGLIELEHVEAARLAVAQRELAQEFAHDLTEIRLPQVDDQRVRAVTRGEVFLPRADRGAGRATGSGRGVDVEQAMLGHLIDKPANSGLGVGRKQFREVFEDGAVCRKCPSRCAGSARVVAGGPGIDDGHGGAFFEQWFARRDRLGAAGFAIA